MDLRAPRSGTLDLKTKSKLAEYAANLRQQWEDEKATIKPRWNAKKKKHMRPDPKWGYIRKTVDDNFPALRNAC